VTALGHTVKGLKTVVAAQAKLLTDCVKIAVPINQFGNPQPAAGETAEGYDYKKGPDITAPSSEFFTTGLDVSSTTDTGAVWFVGGQAACGTDLGESALQHAAARAGVRLPHASMRAPSFVPHGR
jgi:hypothetical protein